MTVASLDSVPARRTALLYNDLLYFRCVRLRPINEQKVGWTVLFGYAVYNLYIFRARFIKAVYDVPQQFSGQMVNLNKKQRSVF